MVADLSERVLHAWVTLVIGDSDTGKTTLVRDLANALVARGLTIAVVDADLGQSEIGPPTTIGLGRVAAPITRLADAEVLALRFVGVTSAARDPLATVAATRRLVDRARRAGLDRVIVDTCGLVRGELGRRLKQATIEALDPDLVIALERDAECEAIVAAYRGLSRPEIVRLAARAPARGRSADVRRRHRERALAAHFAGARSLTFDLSRIVLRSPAPSTDEAPDVSGLEGLLAGLFDADGETLGLGIVREIDLAAGTVRVDTAVAEARPASIAIGHERYAGPDDAASRLTR